MKYFKGFLLKGSVVKQGEEVLGRTILKGNPVYLNLEDLSSIETVTVLEYVENKDKTVSPKSEIDIDIYTMRTGRVFWIYPKQGKS